MAEVDLAAFTGVARCTVGVPARAAVCNRRGPVVFFMGNHEKYNRK